MKLVSFDVWNTLLDMNGMLDAFSAELSNIMGTCIVDVVEAIMLTRARIKGMRARGEGDPKRRLRRAGNARGNPWRGHRGYKEGRGEGHPKCR